MVDTLGDPLTLEYVRLNISAQEARMTKIVALPGDGIGPEIMAAALRVLAELGEFEVDERLVGGASIDAHGTALTDEVLDACRDRRRGAAGRGRRPEVGLDRPGRPSPRAGPARRCARSSSCSRTCGRCGRARRSSTPARCARERIEGTDLLVVRELTGGIYFGDRARRDGTAYDTCVYSEAEIERIARVGFRFARRKVTSVDKANILETSRLWREVVERVAAEHSGTELEHLLVDNAAMQLVSRPADFDVILTENMFGDILSDEAAMLTGSIGMLPSASVGRTGRGCSSRCTARRPTSRAPGSQPACDVRVRRDDAALRP